MEVFNGFYLVIQILLYSLFMASLAFEGEESKSRFCRCFVCLTCAFLCIDVLPILIPLKIVSLSTCFVLVLCEFAYLSLKKSFLYTVVFFLTVLSSELLAVFTFQQFSTWLTVAVSDGASGIMVGEWEELFIKSILCVYFACISMIFMIFRANIDVGSKVKIMLLQVCMLLFQVSFFLVYYRTKGEFVTGENVLVCVGYCLLSVIIYGICAYDINISFQGKEKKLELLYLSHEKAQVMHYYQLATKHSVDTRKLKHDIVNQIQCLNGLIHSDLGQAKKFIRELEEKVTERTPVFFTGNAIVDTVLTIKYDLAKKYHIPIDIYVDQIGSAVIADMDMCNLLSNVLDNAIEASLNLENSEREIEFRMVSRGEYIVVKCKNHFAGDVKEKRGEFWSKKRQFSQKGYGLKILEEVAEKYDGSLMTDYDHEKFEITILLKILLKVDNFRSSS